ncbi:hypothetical protein WA158_004804 [Blastocystis sp. Blastoise]
MSNDEFTAFCDYIVSVVTEKSSPFETRIDVISNLLQSATTVNISSFMEELAQKMKEYDHPNQSEVKQIVEGDKQTEEAPHHEHISEKRRRIAEERRKAQEEAKHVKVNEVDAKVRARLVKQYGFESLMDTDGDTVVYRESADEQPSIEGVNDNVARAKEAERQKKLEAKAKYDEEQARIVAQKEAEKAKKEKAKQKTQKRERQACRF